MPEIENISVTDANLLLSMGVPQGLLDSAAFDAKDCAILYQRLRISMSRFLQYPLKINCLSQLLLLTGRLELITPELMTSVLSFVDNWGARASHYAAWSGNKDMLEWIKKQAPQLLEVKDNNGGTIAHYAAWSGNKDMLEWIKNQAPQLLEVKTNDCRTIAHYAAWSGNKDMLEWIKNQVLQLLEIKTKNGQTIAHYAAWSGNKDMLEWIKNQAPRLLEIKTKNGQTIAHYAAKSGNKDMLEWIKNQAPQLLEVKDNDGGTIAHYAAWSGNKDMLEWIKNQAPQLLEVKANDGETIAHFAARSGNKDMLGWIKNQAPQLLEVKDDYGQTIAHYAAISGNTHLFNWSLSLSKTTDFEILSSVGEQYLKEISQTLLSALSTNNFSLTEVTLPPQVDQNTSAAITVKLSENEAIKKMLPSLERVIMGYYQQESPFSTLPSELLYEIFSKMFPASTLKAKITVVYKRLMNNLCPANMEQNGLLLTSYKNNMTQLLSMGVPQGLLDSTAFDAKDCATLYQRLRIPMSRFLQYPLKINYLVQLLLLTGRLELITPELMTSVLSFVDNWGARASHYAAWSGNKDMLEWIKNQAPQLLKVNVNNGVTIAHYAARSGNKDMLEWIKNQAPQLLEIKTKNGVTIAHYAAWSGNKDMLEWIKNQAPQLLEVKTNDGRTIAHYAAWSGNKDMLEWIKNQAPQLLEVKDNDGGTIAHDAAWSGNKDMLEWVKNQAPQLLEVKANDGGTIAHFAARSGNKDMLGWIKNQAPQLLEVKDDYGQTIAHYAAISGNTHLFNWSLSLSKTTDFKIFSTLRNPHFKDISQTLLSTLSTNNFSLTEVTLPPQVDQSTSAAITVKLSENEAIKKMLPKLERVIMGYYQQESPFSTLPSELLYEIFSKMFPASTFKAKITFIYNRLMDSLSPDNMEKNRLLLLTNYKNNMTQLIEAELERLELSKEPIFFGLVEGSLSKINAYQEIKNVLSRDYNSLDEMKEEFIIAYKKARPILHHQRNKIHSFFNSTHIPKSQQALEKIANILNVQLSASVVPSV